MNSGSVIWPRSSLNSGGSAARAAASAIALPQRVDRDAQLLVRALERLDQRQRDDAAEVADDRLDHARRMTS